MLKASDIAVSEPASPKRPSVSLSEQRNLCFLWEIVTNAPHNDQGFIPQKHLWRCDKETSPFHSGRKCTVQIASYVPLSEAAESKNQSQNSCKGRARLHHTLQLRATNKESMYLEVLLHGFANYPYNLLTLQPEQMT